MDLIYTDLDGTLLDHHTYSWEAARPAIEALRRRSIPWVMVSSKTRAEIEHWREETGNRHPFIVENGGAACIPAGYFPDAPERIEFGTPYTRLVADLAAAARESRCRVRGFAEMTAEEVAQSTGLPLWQAELAKRREYDEPFVVLDPDRALELARAIERLGRRWTRGGRYWHILGANDKRVAVDALSGWFARAFGPVRTIGLGDGLNDAEFLGRMDVAVLVRSAQSEELRARVPHGGVTEAAGPQGWSEAVLKLIGS